MTTELVLLAWAVLALGVCLGWRMRGAKEARRRASEEQAREQERARRVNDTKRLSVARPGTRPARISKASISMDSSNMGQRPEEV